MLTSSHAWRPRLAAWLQSPALGLTTASTLSAGPTGATFSAMSATSKLRFLFRNPQLLSVAKDSCLGSRGP